MLKKTPKEIPCTMDENNCCGMERICASPTSKRQTSLLSVTTGVTGNWNCKLAVELVNVFYITVSIKLKSKFSKPDEKKRCFTPSLSENHRGGSRRIYDCSQA